MPELADGSRSCLDHHRAPPRRLRFWGRWGVRESLVGVAAFGLVIGLGVAGEVRVCEGLEQGGVAFEQRDAALASYMQARCEAEQCESIELVAHASCRAKVRVVERRLDDYGDVIGTFRVDEGLVFRPMVDRWGLRAVLDDKQMLGLSSR
jgi:hypothetical protein